MKPENQGEAGRQEESSMKLNSLRKYIPLSAKPATDYSYRQPSNHVGNVRKSYHWLKNTSTSEYIAENHV